MTAVRPLLNVLIIDDSDDDAVLLARALREAGFAPATLRIDTGDALAAALADQAWDAILCDFNMPRFDTLTALRMVRGAGLDLPFIVVSGTVSEEKLVELMKAGANDVVLKDSVMRLGPAIQRELADLDARRLARTTEVRLKQAIESIDDGVLLYDADDRLIYCNENAKRLYPEVADEMTQGAAYEDLVRLAVERGVFPSAHPEPEQWIAKQLQRHRACKRPYEFTLADKQTILVREYRTPEGGIVAIRTDITERKRAEAELHQARKLEAVGQLTGGIAHDFNNLLTVVLGNLELLETALPQDEKVQRRAQAAIDAAQSGADLCKRLLAFARRQALQQKTIDVNELISGMHDLFRRTLGDHIEIRIVPDTEIWPITTDPNQLEMALLNLAVNARDAMPRGGSLTIRTTSVSHNQDEAQSKEIQPGDYVSIAVQDTGEGIPKNILSEVFHPFFTTKEPGKGTGLGLSMVHGFAKQCAGSISIASTLGKGTTVTLLLPRDEQASPVAKAGAVDHGSRAAASIETILIVEDDDRVREVGVSILEGLGYKVLEANSGPTALEIIDSGQVIDLLFSDVLMPGGMNGMDLAQQAIQRRPDLKVLHTSGYAQTGNDDLGDANQIADLILKPYRKQDLALKVREVMTRASK